MRILTIQDFYASHTVVPLPHLKSLYYLSYHRLAAPPVFLGSTRPENFFTIFLGVVLASLRHISFYFPTPKNNV